MLLVLASANNNKVREIREILPSHFRFQGLAEVGITVDIPETGSTIEENARIKAQFVIKTLPPGTFVLADDSGFEVEALDGAPGVYSARYAGDARDDAANNKKVLQVMQDEKNRHARFVTVLSLVGPGVDEVFYGIVEGSLTYAPHGDGGFGYDPLFVPDGYKKTFAEMRPDEKNAISHRALALRELEKFLQRL